MVDPSDFQALTETPSTNLTNIDEMVLASEYIGTVKILDLYMEGKVHNGNTYRCKVEALSKGNNLNTYSDGTILLTIRKNVVTVGETYIIGFSPIGEGSLIYVQTSIDGVYEYSDELLKNEP
jgi:hypothetical protein